jgi:hypothetical protein
MSQAKRVCMREEALFSSSASLVFAPWMVALNPPEPIRAMGKREKADAVPAGKKIPIRRHRAK